MIAKAPERPATEKMKTDPIDDMLHVVFPPPASDKPLAAAEKKELEKQKITAEVVRKNTVEGERGNVRKEFLAFAEASQKAAEVRLKAGLPAFPDESAPDTAAKIAKLSKADRAVIAREQEAREALATAMKSSGKAVKTQAFEVEQMTLVAQSYAGLKAEEARTAELNTQVAKLVAKPSREMTALEDALRGSDAAAQQKAMKALSDSLGEMPDADKERLLAALVPQIQAKAAAPKVKGTLETIVDEGTNVAKGVGTKALGQVVMGMTAGVNATGTPVPGLPQIPGSRTPT